MGTPGQLVRGTEWTKGGKAAATPHCICYKTKLLPTHGGAAQPPPPRTPLSKFPVNHPKVNRDWETVATSVASFLAAGNL